MAKANEVVVVEVRRDEHGRVEGAEVLAGFDPHKCGGSVAAWVRAEVEKFNQWCDQAR